MRIIQIVLAALLVASASASAAELFYLDHDAYTGKYVGPVGPLVISGDIVAGDYERLLAKINDDPAHFLSQNVIILASTDGDVSEALKLAAFIQSLDSEVTVGPMTGRCAGGCFFIYAAAARRATDGVQMLGFGNPIAPAAQAYLLRSGVPKDLLDELLRQPPTSMYWLSERDEARLGDKSPAFAHDLATRCAWNDAAEHEAMAGKRSFEELQPMWACRTRLARTQAEAILRAARVPHAPAAVH
jgi:hypothetical protein